MRSLNIWIILRKKQNKEFLKNGIHPRPSSIFQKQKFRFSSTELNERRIKQRDKKITAYNSAYAIF